MRFLCYVFIAICVWVRTCKIISFLIIKGFSGVRLLHNSRFIGVEMGDLFVVQSGTIFVDCIFLGGVGYLFCIRNASLDFMHLFVCLIRSCMHLLRMRVLAQ